MVAAAAATAAAADGPLGTVPVPDHWQEQHHRDSSSTAAIDTASVPLGKGPAATTAAAAPHAEHAPTPASGAAAGRRDGLGRTLLRARQLEVEAHLHAAVGEWGECSADTCTQIRPVMCETRDSKIVPDHLCGDELPEAERACPAADACTATTTRLSQLPAPKNGGGSSTARSGVSPRAADRQKAGADVPAASGAGTPPKGETPAAHGSAGAREEAGKDDSDSRVSTVYKNGNSGGDSSVEHGGGGCSGEGCYGGRSAPAGAGAGTGGTDARVSMTRQVIWRYEMQNCLIVYFEV